MSEQDQIQREIAELIVTTLNLEMEPDEIGADDPLFGDDGLGLDSIDALELALVIDHRYNIKISAEDEENETRFASLAALATFVGESAKSTTFEAGKNSLHSIP